MKRGVWIGIGVGLVVLITVVFLLGRNKTTAPTKVTLSIWSPFDEGKTFQTISQKYLASNSNVTLDFKYIQAADAKDYEAQVVNAIANGKGPDIWLARSDWLPKHVDKLAAATLKGSTADAVTEVKKNILANLVDQNTINNQLFGLPLSADALAIIYNQTLYNQITADFKGDQAKLAQTIPASWDDLKKQAGLISQSKNGVVTRSAIALGTNTMTFAAADVFSAFLVQAGAGNVVSTDGQSVAFNLPKIQTDGSTKLPATEALSFYTSFATPGQANFSWTDNLGDPIQAFLNQKTDALIGYYSTLQTIIGKKPGFSMNVAPLVQDNPTATSPRVDYGVTWSGVVTKNGPHVATAWNYLGSLSSTANIQQYATATNRLSIAVGDTNPGVLQPELINAGNAASLFQKELLTSRSLVTPEWQFSTQVLQDTLNLVIGSGQTPQTAIDSAAARFKTQFLSNP